jgi:hypothetical protein
VVQLLRDENLRAKLREGAQRRIFGEFDWGKLVVRVEGAYRESERLGVTRTERAQG